MSLGSDNIVQGDSEPLKFAGFRIHGHLSARKAHQAVEEGTRLDAGRVLGTIFDTAKLPCRFGKWEPEPVVTNAHQDCECVKCGVEGPF